ncbi:MAG: gluconate 2-dehydrogenase subunit 3 family protein [Flammeovirgaceae bacterium]|nr:MAG: gluconate 2-dehydrogenase subunit 3 family protein [Flammeovirgaceae bacterium]
MDRRDLLKRIALVTGAAVVGGDFFLMGCKQSGKPEAGFSPDNIALLNEVGETIIPATQTPGAKAAQVGEFMQVYVTDCYTERQQAAFMEGLVSLQEACNKMHGKSFMDCDEAQRKEFLITLEKEAKVYNQKRDEEDKPKREAHNQQNSTLAWKDQTEFEGSPSHYYTMIKQLTLLGFFTSETGMTETLRHIPVPGRYDGEFPYAKGDKAWAE